MKKNIFIYALLGLMAVVTSCSKTDDTQKPTIPAADLAVWNKVQAFKARMANPLKDGDPLAVDSAVWYIETTLNCTYGDASYEFTDMHTDSAFTTLPVENGQVDMVAVTVAYNQLLDSIRQHYYGLAATDKQFVFANVELIPTGLKTSEVTLKVTSGVGEESESLPVLTFGINDNWMFGGDEGCCTQPDNPIGIGTGQDASDKIEQKIALRKPVKNGNFRYIDPVNIGWIEPSAFPNINDPNPSDGYYNFYLFVSWDDSQNPNPDYHTCLSWQEMNFYLTGSERIIYNTSPTGARPAGKTFVSIDLQPEILMGPTWSEYRHEALITYATEVLVPDPPTSLD